MKFNLSILLVFVFFNVSGQDSKYISKDVEINDLIDGTLLVPNTDGKHKLAIIIADSGPTDRNGNQNFMNNNSLKKLAESLSENGIATFRYDKRIVKQILKKKIDPNITFDNFIEDAISVLDYFKNDEQFSHIYIIGHGQGSLVGMLAAKERANGFISMAGAGQSIDKVITEQIALMDPSLVEGTQKAFDSLKNGKLTNEYPPALGSIFRADVQPFIMNWMQYDPQDIMKSIEIPSLIINGTKDLQVSVDEAKMLKQASNAAQLEVIENMNHVLFIIDGDELENSKSYNESFRPISEQLINSVSKFIHN